MFISQCSIGYQQRDKWGKDPAVERPLAELVDLIHGFGYDGIEIWEPHYGTLDDAGRAAVRQRLAETGLAVPMLSSYFNFTRSEEVAAESLANGRRVLALARELAAARIRIFTGNHRGEDATPAQWDRCVGCLQELSDEAAVDGIGLAAELHDWNLTNTAANARRLVERVGRGNFGIIFQPADIYPDHLAGLELLAPHIVHLHATNKRPPAAGGKPQGCALADGWMDWREMLARLHTLGFAGFVSVEWMGPDPAGVGEREAAWLRGVLAELAAG
jgi:sugar phosphate isomerase/epimerase